MSKFEVLKITQFNNFIPILKVQLITFLHTHLRIFVSFLLSSYLSNHEYKENKHLGS